MSQWTNPSRCRTCGTDSPIVMIQRPDNTKKQVAMGCLTYRDLCIQAQLRLAIGCMRVNAIPSAKIKPVKSNVTAKPAPADPCTTKAHSQSYLQLMLKTPTPTWRSYGPECWNNEQISVGLWDALRISALARKRIIPRRPSLRQMTSHCI